MCHYYFWQSLQTLCVIYILCSSCGFLFALFGGFVSVIDTFNRNNKCLRLFYCHQTRNVDNCTETYLKNKKRFFFTRTHYFVCAVERLYVATKYSMKSFHWNDCARWLTQRRLHNYNEQECITRRYMLKPHWICLNYSVKHDRNALQSNCARYFFIISISPSSAGFTKSITFVIQFNDNNREILFKINRRSQKTRLKRIYAIFRRGIQIHLFPSRSLIYKSDNNIWNYNRELHASKPWRCWHCAIWISQYGIEIRKNHFC